MKIESKKDTTWSIIRKKPVWVNESLLELKRNSQLAFHHEIFKMKFRSWVTLFLNTYPSLFISLISAHIFSTLFTHWSENTMWLFIKKTIIISCNRLNIQCNQLFWRSNWLYYHFDWLKCSSQIWKTFKNNVIYYILDVID